MDALGARPCHEQLDVRIEAQIGLCLSRHGGESKGECA